MRQGVEQVLNTKARQLASRQIQLGLYANSIKKYLSLFRPEQVLIIFLEELENNPFSVMHRVCRFLDLNPEIYRTFDFSPENENLVVHSKHIYRAALMLNRWMEPFLNWYPEVRKVARSIHHRMNGLGKPQHPQDVVKLLNEFYREPNRWLREFILSEFAHLYTVDSLPAWLQEK